MRSKQGRDAAARLDHRVLEVPGAAVTNPEQEIATICNFLDLEYSPDMLAIEHTDRSKVVEDRGCVVHERVGRDHHWRCRQVANGADTRAGRGVRDAAASDELRAPGYETSRGSLVAEPRPVYGAHDAAMRGVNFVRLRLFQSAAAEPPRLEAEARPVRTSLSASSTHAGVRLLVLLSPVYLAVAVWILVDSGGLVFVQARAGRGGRFRC